MPSITDYIHNNYATTPAIAPTSRRNYVTRALYHNDTTSLRHLRLKGVKEDSQGFAASYDYEVKLPLSYWKNLCTPTKDKCMFGQFDGTKLIAIMSAKKWDQDPTGKTAYWGSAYILPEYRGKGIAAPLYKKREQWTRKHPNFTTAVFGVTEGQDRSIIIHTKHGAEYLYTGPHPVAGNPDTTVRYYSKKMKPKLTLISHQQPTLHPAP